MGSILTNNSAQVALQTLNGINRNLGEVQDQISTGLKVGKAKDDAAIFAISQVVRSDIKGFESLSQSISLGSSTVAVASSGAKAIGEALNEIKGKIVSANEDSFDKQTLQNEIASLSEQIEGIVGAAQLNGINLIDGSAGATDFLSSLDRDAAGGVTTSSITVDRQNLSTDAGTVRGGLAGSTGVTADADDATFTLAANAATADDIKLVIDATNLAEGDEFSVTIGDQTATYTVTAADLAAADSNDAIATAVSDSVAALGVTGVAVDAATTTGTIVFTNDGTGNVERDVSASVTSVDTGDLADLATIDVTTDAAGALDTIEGLIGAVTETQAALGTSESRLEIQGDFLQKLTDSFKTGLGTLVDADLEEASARLQSLQVQQQLGTQALSIANQAPQSILSLFR